MDRSFLEFDESVSSLKKQVMGSRKTKRAAPIEDIFGEDDDDDDDDDEDDGEWAETKRVTLTHTRTPRPTPRCCSRENVKKKKKRARSKRKEEEKERTAPLSPQKPFLSLSFSAPRRIKAHSAARPTTTTLATSPTTTTTTTTTRPPPRKGAGGSPPPTTTTRTKTTRTTSDLRAQPLFHTLLAEETSSQKSAVPKTRAGAPDAPTPAEAPRSRPGERTCDEERHRPPSLILSLERERERVQPETLEYSRAGTFGRSYTSVHVEATMCISAIPLWSFSRPCVTQLRSAFAAAQPDDAPQRGIPQVTSRSP